jgi:hypothetical protein
LHTIIPASNSIDIRTTIASQVIEKIPGCDRARMESRQASKSLEVVSTTSQKSRLKLTKAEWEDGNSVVLITVLKCKTVLAIGR